MVHRVAGILLGLGSSLLAQGQMGETLPGRDWVFQGGLMTFVQPRYPGSEHLRIVALPVVGAVYKERLNFGSSRVAIGAGLGWKAWIQGPWTFEVGLGMGERRPESRDEALAGMGNRAASLWAGGGLTWRARYGSLGLKVAQGLKDEAGLRATLETGTFIPLRPGVALTLGAQASWGNATHLAFDFGMTPDQAARRAALLASGDRRLRPGEARVYRPEAGLREVQGSLGLSWRMEQRWRLFGALTGTALQDKARQSPLVRKDTYVSAVLGLFKTF